MRSWKIHYGFRRLKNAGLIIWMKFSVNILLTYIFWSQHFIYFIVTSLILLRLYVDFYRNEYQSKAYLFADQFDDVFGSLVSDSDLHFKLFSFDSIRVNAFDVFAGNLCLSKIYPSFFIFSVSLIYSSNISSFCYFSQRSSVQKSFLSSKYFQWQIYSNL